MQVLFRSLSFFRHPIRAISRNMKKFAGTYSFVFPGSRQRFILTQDPAFINYVLRENHSNYHKSHLTSERAARLFGKGLLFSNGDYWLRQRRLIQPGFHQKKIQGLYGIVVKTIEESLADFPAGDRVDVYPLMYRLAFNIAIRSLFDIELSPDAMSELSLLFSELQDFLIKDINKPVHRILYRFTREDRKHYKKSEKLRALIHAIMQQRLAEPREYNDLLDMLLQARYEDTGEPMSEEQIIDEVLILLFAGHETTATSLSWLLFQVAPERAIQEKLTKSIEQTDIYDSIRNEYLQAVINESMRLRPAAWMTDRVALADDRFGGFSFPKGTVVMPFFYGLHRNTDHWTDAGLFKPERFIDEQGKIRKSSAYFPFGAGPRMCIGNNFAMAEMSLVLHAFFTRFRIAATGQEPKMKPLMTLRPDKIILAIQKRAEPVN